jgi:outer membrane protein assembly factor BamD
MNSETHGKIIRIRIALSLLLVVFFLNGCSILNIFSKKDPPRLSPEGLYSRASLEYSEGNYKRAREYFLRVKETYPLHELAVLAEIGVADSFFSDKEYSAARDAYSDFVSLHPLDENVPYAIYQMGMCHYHQMEALDRDQTETIKASNEWERLISRYPESKFSTMAKKMLREVRQRLAEREFYVGRFYLRQKKYQAALARFEKITSEYPNVGLDYKIEYYIRDTKAKIAVEEKKARGK